MPRIQWDRHDPRRQCRETPEKLQNSEIFHKRFFLISNIAPLQAFACVAFRARVSMDPASDFPPVPTQSAEDYLERIHELIEEKGYARVVDIALSLNVKQSSVTGMVQKLGELGYLNYEKYRGLVLTDKGREVALGIQRRHATLSRFLTILGINDETQKHDIEGIEHHLSPETVQAIADLTEFFEANTAVLKRFHQRRQRGAQAARPKQQKKTAEDVSREAS